MDVIDENSTREYLEKLQLESKKFKEVIQKLIESYAKSKKNIKHLEPKIVDKNLMDDKLTIFLNEQPDLRQYLSDCNKLHKRIELLKIQSKRHHKRIEAYLLYLDCDLV